MDSARHIADISPQGHNKKAAQRAGSIE